MAYKISSDDPDIIIMKEMFGKDLDVFHPRHKRTHIPGSEPLKWGQLDVISGRLLIRYLNHCGEHCKYLLKWQGKNFEEVIQLIPKLVERSQEDKQLAAVLKAALDSVAAFEEDTTYQSKYDSVILNSTKAWSALADYCVENGVFAAVTKITSDTKVRKHHFMAVVATRLAEHVSDSLRIPYKGSPAKFLPLIFTLIQDAEKAQALEQDKKEDKKRQIQSPDQFLMHEYAKKNSDEPYLTPEILRLVFLKGWLYHFTSGDEKYTHKQLTYTIPEKLGLHKSDKTISRWLTKIKKPGALLVGYGNKPDQVETNTN